jgi:hypothetical protein
MRLGSAIHLGYLEPELFGTTYALQPEDFGPRNKGEGKKKWDAFKAANVGKEIFSHEEAQVIWGCVSSLNHIRPELPDAEVEVSAFAEVDGIPLKARADIDDGEYLWDVKTTIESVDHENLPQYSKRQVARGRGLNSSSSIRRPHITRKSNRFRQAISRSGRRISNTLVDCITIVKCPTTGTDTRTTNKN